MSPEQSSDHTKLQLSFSQKLSILLSFSKDKIVEQIQCVWFVLAYMILFQLLVLGLPVVYAAMIGVGIVIVIVGLAFFMEGLRLGLMPLGEVLGSTLPRKKVFGIPCLPMSLAFGFVLGVFATFAEPAIAVLQQAGAAVRPDQAPLLYTLLNPYSSSLVLYVGIGVGIAVMLGVLRFYKSWSLKPFIYVGVLTLSAITLYFQFEPSGTLSPVLGLAWDCGAVTTGPVTVPLVLALGIGVCRIVATGGSSNTGFGVVTLASLFPILAVLTLSFQLYTSDDYYGAANFKQGNDDGDKVTADYIIKNRKTADKAKLEKAFDAFFESNSSHASVLASIHDKEGPVVDEKSRGTDVLKAYINLIEKSQPSSTSVQEEDFDQEELSAFREQGTLPANHKIKFMNTDDNASWSTTAGGIAFTGDAGPSSFTIVKVADATPEPPSKSWLLPKDEKGEPNRTVGQDLAVKFSSYFTTADSLKDAFFPVPNRGALEGAVWAIAPLSLILLGLLIFGLRQKPKHLDELIIGIICAVAGMTFFGLGIAIGLTPMGDQLGTNIVTSFTPTKPWQYLSGIQEPLIAGESGKFIAIIFAFILGYGATLAEPALNALGATVEKITVGAFKKSLLMQAVAIGVACGIGTGVAKIAFNLDLWYLLIPPYLALLILTFVSSEDFVNFGWDSAGVTTGPITVPLVLAMGLGIGMNVPGVIDGFGVLSLASVGPIITVLTVGLLVRKKPKPEEEESPPTVVEAS
tara:strand:+ start:4077 stop:6305 length:2229 start_codon:yes stop_codon:yes gene_type:complete